MADHFVEIITFSPSTSYLGDPSATLNASFQGRSGLPQELLHTFHGCSHENKSEAYLIGKWGASADDSSLTLKEVIASHVGSVASRLQVDFRGDSVKAFRAPIIELAILTLKPGFTEQSITKHLDTLTGQDTKTVVSATWGRTNQPGTLVLLVGWESKEAHEEVVKNPTPEIGALVGELFQMAELKVTHVALVEV